MENLPHFVLGLLGPLALALFLVLGSAHALQAWHNVRQPPGPSMVVDAGHPAASYWFGRP